VINMEYWSILVKWKKQNPKEYDSVIKKTVLLIAIPMLILGILIGLNI